EPRPPRVWHASQSRLPATPQSKSTALLVIVAMHPGHEGPVEGVLDAQAPRETLEVEPTPSAAAQFPYSAAEWQALFPDGIGDAADALLPPKPDGAPETFAPSADAVLRSLEPFPRLRGLLRAQLLLQFVNLDMSWRPAVPAALLIAIACSVFQFGGPTHSTKQMAVSVALIAGYYCLVCLSRLLFGHRSFPHWGGSDPGKVALAARARFLADKQAARYAGAAFYADLVVAGASELVAHADHDKQCTCSRPSCGGSLLDKAVAYRSFEIVFRLLLGLFQWFVSVWTPMVSLGIAFWASPAWAAIGTVFLILMAYFHGEIISLIPANIPLLMLTSRLRRRALRLALADLVLRCEGQLRTAAERRTSPTHSPTGTSNGASHRTSDYRILYQALSSRWRLGIQSGFRLTAFLIIFPYTLFSILVYAATGACIPLWPLCWLLYGTFTLFTELLAVAASNAELRDASIASSDARTRLRTLLTDAEDAPRIRAHAEALEAFAAADAERATFLGFEVRYGSVRALLVAVLTVGFAAYGLMRNLGVQVTVESVCLG
ncbi:hypothetical protein DFJ74DRAFT_715202, partial [Hyaloraphidium curvatum]